MAKPKRKTPQIERDRHQEVTDRLISIMEEGRKPWVCPWDKSAAAAFSAPRNPVTGTRYSGINKIILMSNDLAFETGDPRWCTYKQAESKGWQVKKGAKSESVFFYRRIPVSAKDEDNENDVRVIPIMKAFPVFHASQIEGIPEYDPTDRKPWATIEAASIIMERSGADIRHGGDQAFYRPEGDFINMPPKEAFETVEGYAATALHELGHWTSHEERLNRTIFFQHQNKEEYAKEELRAELASVFICSEIGISPEMPGHANYLASWLRVLQNDKREIFRAAKDAQLIADYCLAFHPEYQVQNQRDAEQTEEPATEMKMAG